MEAVGLEQKALTATRLLGELSGAESESAFSNLPINADFTLTHRHGFLPLVAVRRGGRWVRAGGEKARSCNSDGSLMETRINRECRGG